MKTKRKDLDVFNEEFSGFSLSSPARKIRRLDAELPPIMEEENEQPQMAVHKGGSLTIRELEGSTIEEDHHLDNAVSENQERAIVPFKPVNSRSLSVSVNSDLVSSFKNQFLRAANPCGLMDSAKNEEDEIDSETDGCLAMVPWIPSQIPPAQSMVMESEQEKEEEMEGVAMDIEEDNNVGSCILEEEDKQGQARQFVESFYHHQQHCMIIPQIPQNTSTPITLFR